MYCSYFSVGAVERLAVLDQFGFDEQPEEHRTDHAAAVVVANVIPVFLRNGRPHVPDRREPAAILVGVGDDHRAELAEIAEALRAVRGVARLVERREQDRDQERDDADDDEEFDQGEGAGECETDDEKLLDPLAVPSYAITYH